MAWSNIQVREIVAQRGKRSAELLATDYGTTKSAISGIWFRARKSDPSIPKLGAGLSELSRRKIAARNARIKKAKNSGVPRCDLVSRFGLHPTWITEICREAA